MALYKDVFFGVTVVVVGILWIGCCGGGWRFSGWWLCGMRLEGFVGKMLYRAGDLWVWVFCGL